MPATVKLSVKVATPLAESATGFGLNARPLDPVGEFVADIVT